MKTPFATQKAYHVHNNGDDGSKGFDDDPCDACMYECAERGSSIILWGTKEESYHGRNV